MYLCFLSPSATQKSSRLYFENLRIKQRNTLHSFGEGAEHHSLKFLSKEFPRWDSVHFLGSANYVRISAVPTLQKYLDTKDVSRIHLFRNLYYVSRSSLRFIANLLFFIISNEILQLELSNIQKWGNQCSKIRYIEISKNIHDF